ncbi:MAG: T9SS type A sorting domain-containing protein [Bacteroidetes bacterium]|nr:T9SS type A sorting domain-containing protein [Bacteroidota bacterium]
MKNNVLQFLSLGLFVMVIMTGFNKTVLAHSNGSPSGYTGSPGDGHTCTSCHGGSSSTVTGWITSNVPTAGYTGGTTYTITITATGTGHKGFEVSPQNAAGTQLGTMIAGSGSKLVGGTKYCTHNSAPTGDPTVWTCSWTAPIAGTGTVTMYGAIVVTEPVTKLCTLVINESVPLTATATATPSTINQGQTSQLNVVAAGGSGTYTYSWTSNPAGFTSNIQNPVVSPTVTTVYTATVNDGTSNATSNCTVTVLPALPLSVTATANPYTIILGGSSQLNASPAGGSGNYTYSWTSNPAGYTSNLQNPVVSPTITTIYTATVNDGTNSISDTAIVHVNIAPLTANATATPNSICEGSSSQLNVIVNGGSGTYTYSWTSIPAGFSSNIQNPVVTPSESTLYLVTVNDGTSSVNSSVNVTVTEPATAAAGADTIACNTAAQFQISGSATNYSSIQWTTSGTGTFSNINTLSTIYYPSAADKTSGGVNLILTVSPLSPCSSTASSVKHVQIDICNGTPQTGHEPLSILLGPNPTIGLFILTVTGLDNQETFITFYDVREKLIFSDRVYNEPVYKRNLDFSHLAKGIYLVKVVKGSEVKTAKLVVQ